jgi:hypothetical protein
MVSQTEQKSTKLWIRWAFLHGLADFCSVWLKKLINKSNKIVPLSDSGRKIHMWMKCHKLWVKIIQWVSLSLCDKPSKFTRMSHFGVDRQSVHLETECHSSKLSQQTVRWVDASFGSKCRVVGLSVDGSSRHRPKYILSSYCICTVFLNNVVFCDI